MVNYVFYTTDEAGQSIMAARPVRSKEEYIELRNSEQNRRQVAQYHSFVERGVAEDEVRKAKFRLAKFAYNDLMPDGRVKEACHPSATFFLDIDLDDPASQAGEIIQRALKMKDDLGLLMMERSVGGSVHLVCRRQQGRTVLENQVRLAMMLHTEIDTNACNLERIVFTTPSEDILYLDEELFNDPTTLEQSEQEMTELKYREEHGLEEVLEGAKKKDKHYKPWEDTEKKVVAASLSPAETSAETSSEISADSPSEVSAPLPESGAGGEALGIFDAVFRASGLPRAHLVADGHLHTTLLLLLSQGLAKMMPRKQLEEVLKLRMPTYAGCEDCRKLLSSAYDDYKMQNRTMTQQQMSIYTQAVSAKPDAAAEATAEGGGSLPELPPKLPSLMALYAGAQLDECFRPAVMMNIFGALNIHMKDVRFADNATLAVEPSDIALLIGPPQSGKSCINKPIAATNADIQEQDTLARAQLDAWNQMVKQASANAAKPAEPKCPIQLCMSDMTSAALIKRLEAAAPRFLFTKMDEIELLRGIQGRGSKGVATELLRLAYDNAPYGAERATAQGVSGCLPLRWNLSISTTMQNGRSFLGAQAAYDGTLSRLSVSTIQRPLSASRPRFGLYDADFRQELQPYLDRLKLAQGTYTCPEAVQLMDDLRAEVVEHITLSGDQVAQAMYERGIVNAFKRAMTLYVAEGGWGTEIGDFARWSFYYDLECKRMIFGDLIERGMSGEEVVQTGRRGPQNLLAKLPEVFTREELIRVRAEAGLSADVRSMLNNWRHRGYISVLEGGRYGKTRPRK